MCGNYHDSEDITQETFVKTYQALSQYNPAFRFSTWLYQIALNIIRDRLKKKNLESISMDSSPYNGKTLKDELISGPENNPEHYLDNQAWKENIQRAIMALPVQYREIIVLRHLRELSYRELASILKISPDTARVRLCRAREQLKKLLQKTK